MTVVKREKIQLVMQWKKLRIKKAGRKFDLTYETVWTNVARWDVLLVFFFLFNFRRITIQNKRRIFILI